MAFGQRKFRVLVLACLLASVPAIARAQSAIAGSVTDGSGGALPGVTVDVSSPALIEKSRAVITDGEGRYTVIDLRPGVYAISFSLPGFSTVKRDGVELPANFTATINVELKVGALEETITVSGLSPVIDTSSAVQQQVLPRALLDAVPTGRSIPTLGAMLPGARLALPDVGGTSGMQNRDLTVHGSDGRDTTFLVDGMVLNGLEGDGSVQSYFNDMMFEEVSYQTSAITAETSAGGVRANMIPKDGGNAFRGTAFFSAGNHDLQSNNADAALAQGLRAPDRLDKVWDINIAQGGPLRRDRIWFFASMRDWGVYQYIANSFFKNGDQTIDDARITSGVVRLTARLGAKHKVAGYLDRIRKFRGHENSAPAGYAIAGEATDIRAPKQYYTNEIKYTGTLTSRMLVEAGFAINNESYSLTPLDPASVPPLPTSGVNPVPTVSSTIPKRDVILQTAYDQYDGGVYYREPIRKTVMAAASYVTGSHNIKAGVQYGFGYFWRQRREAADLIQLYRSGVPAQVIIHNTPQDSLTNMNADAGVFIQDQWVLGRLTLNPGIRFEHFNASTEERSALPGRFVPYRTFPTRKNVPNWNDVSPRVGFVWDVAGDGKTAVKMGWGKYVRAYTTGFSDVYDPNFYASATLTWADLNNDDIAQGGVTFDAAGNRVPCVFRSPGCEIDFSTLPSTFGVKPPQNFAADIARPFQYEMNASIQRQLLQGTSVTAAFVRRDYRNLIWSDNRAINPSDYTLFKVPSPLNPAVTVPIYNLDPAKATAFDVLDQNSSSNRRVFTGVDINFQSRAKGLNIFGGVTAGHTVANTCEVEDPNFLLYCDMGQYRIPFYTQFKLNGSYSLPYKLQVSASLQSYNGDARNASVDGTIAAIDPSLRVIWNVDRTTFRNLTGANLTQSSVNVQLVDPGSKLLARHNQVDLRFRRPLEIGKVSLEAQFDAYNALNSGVVLSAVQTYGTALDRPASILQGRLIRLGMQAKW